MEAIKFLKEWERCYSVDGTTPAEVLRYYKGRWNFVEEPDGSSEDPSWDIEFSDESRVHIGNPNGAVFSPFVILILTDEQRRKLRRRIEDRLRKDAGFLEEVAKIFV